MIDLSAMSGTTSILIEHMILIGRRRKRRRRN
jgi:hypothetical protein